MEELYTNGWTLLYHLVSSNCDSVDFYFPAYSAAAWRYFGQDTAAYQLQYQGLLFFETARLRCGEFRFHCFDSRIFDCPEAKRRGPQSPFRHRLLFFERHLLGGWERSKAIFYQEQCLRCKQELALANPENHRWPNLTRKASFLENDDQEGKALPVLDTALALAVGQGMQPLEIAELHGKLGYSFRNQQQFDSSIVHYQQAIALVGDRMESWDVGRLPRMVGAQPDGKGQLVAAEKTMDEVLKAQGLHGTRSDSASWLQTFGRIIRRQGRHEEALACYLRSVSLLGGQVAGDLLPLPAVLTMRKIRLGLRDGGLCPPRAF